MRRKTKVLSWVRNTICVILLIGAVSCQSEYYWGAYATPYGEKAQKRYLKNQHGHKAQKRFYHGGPTFGAQDISRK